MNESRPTLSQQLTVDDNWVVVELIARCLLQCQTRYKSTLHAKSLLKLIIIYNQKRVKINKRRLGSSATGIITDSKITLLVVHPNDFIEDECDVAVVDEAARTPTLIVRCICARGP